MDSKQDRPNWDEYFLEMCEVVKKRSIDENTKVGAVIVDSRHTVVSTGYNSFPAGIDDDVFPKDRKPIKIQGIGEVTKYDVMSHAEVSAITTAAQKGVSTRGCVLYCTYLPCNSCAVAIINAGIVGVVAKTRTPNKGWDKLHLIAEELFRQADVDVVIMDKEKE